MEEEGDPSTLVYVVAIELWVGLANWESTWTSMWSTNRLVKLGSILIPIATLDTCCCDVVWMYEKTHVV